MGQPIIRVLLIEDNPGDTYLVQLALGRAPRSYEMSSAVRLGDAIKLLEEELFDVVLADLSLPDSSGTECIERLRRAAPQVPVVVLTSLASDTAALQAIHEGAQDYLVKDRIDHETLDQAIEYAVQRQRVLAENAELLRNLQESKELLEKKNQRLERLCSTAQEFVDNVSHEFRTPLTVIMEYASLLRDGIVGEISEEQQRLLNVIDDRACDLNTMVDDMLDVSRLESGLLGSWREECHVADIVQHVFPALQQKAKVRSVALETDIPADLPAVFCDAEKAGRVLINLVVNAIKFAHDPAQVRVWVEHNDPSEIRVNVTDNGPGIPPHRLEEIFERFSQLRTDVQQTNKGFGLGLNIAQELASLNLGRMYVDSVVGEGSTFSFTLPIADPIAITQRYLNRLSASQELSPIVSAVRLGAPLDLGTSARRDIERFLRGLLRQNDLVLPCGSQEWLLLVATPGIELESFIQRVHEELELANRNRPDGPLPHLELAAIGSWHSAESEEQVLECVERCCRRMETCDV